MIDWLKFYLLPSLFVVRFLRVSLIHSKEPFVVHWMKRWMNERINELMKEWGWKKKGWMNEQMKITEFHHSFRIPHLHFAFLQVKEWMNKSNTKNKKYIKKSINHINQSINHIYIPTSLADESFISSVTGSSERMNEWINEWMNQRISDRKKNEQWIIEWKMNKVWMNHESINEWFFNHSTIHINNNTYHHRIDYQYDHLLHALNQSIRHHFLNEWMNERNK